MDKVTPPISGHPSGGASPLASELKPACKRTRSMLILVVLWACYFLIWGLMPLRSGQIVPGPLISGLLYTVFGLAIARGAPLSCSRLWFLAALPVGFTPAGLFVLVGTILVTIRLRKK